MYDKESKGYINGFELRQALNSVGYHLNTHILNIMCHRYATKDGNIMFDDFIMCAVRLKTMIGKFNFISLKIIKLHILITHFKSNYPMRCFYCNFALMWLGKLLKYVYNIIRLILKKMLDNYDHNCTSTLCIVHANWINFLIYKEK